MENALQYILSKYPDHRAKILSLYKSDEDFRILCADYQANIEALGECKMNLAKDNELETELTQLVLDLEKEIAHLL